MTSARPSRPSTYARSYQLDGVPVEALRGVTLRIDQGDYVASSARPGSGKSTLMHLLGCLDRPTSGTLRLGGRDVATLSDAELADLRNRTIGFVFQSFQLLGRTSALDNVALPLVYRGVRRAERRARAAAALRRGRASGTGWATARPAVRRRAAAGGHRPRPGRRAAVLLADEPTGNLDTAQRRRGDGPARAGSTPSAGSRSWSSPTTSRSPRTRRRQIHVRDGLIERDTGGVDRENRRGVPRRARRAAGQPAAQRADHARRRHRRRRGRDPGGDRQRREAGGREPGRGPRLEHHHRRAGQVRARRGAVGQPADASTTSTCSAGWSATAPGGRVGRRRARTVRVGSREAFATVNGVNENVPNVFDRPLARGDYITATDVDTRRPGRRARLRRSRARCSATSTRSAGR